MATGKRWLSRVARAYRFSALAFALFALGAVAYAITALAGYRGVQQMAALSEARHRDGVSIQLVQRAYAALFDFESGRRGAVLGESEELYRHYDVARTTLLQSRDTLRADGHPAEPEEIHTLRDRLDTLIAQRVATSDTRVNNARGLSGVSVQGPTAPQQMVDLRFAFTQLESDLIQLARLRTRETHDVARATTRIVGWSTIGGTALQLAALGLLWRERRLRDAADAAVRRATEHLEQQVVQRTHALAGAIRQMQSFAGQLDRQIEQERRRLSREVHDQLGQIATVAKIVVGEMAREHPEVPAATIGQLTELLDDAIRTTRRIAAELRPPMLDDLGLGAAAAHHVRHVAAAGKLSADIDVTDDARLPADRANQLFRILQEATTNVLRHAEAANLRVFGRVEGQHYRLDVEDDGRGMQDEARPDASGLRNMRERAALVGGSLQFGPRPQGGTRVTVRVPLEAPPT